MKVSELEGIDLDFWVAKTEGYDIEIWRDGCYRIRYEGDVIAYVGNMPITKPCLLAKYAPSTDWRAAGPIIDRELCSLIPYEEEKRAEGIWRANGIYKCQLKGMGFVGEGKTILEAAMRAYVGSKFGEEVNDSQAHNI